MPTSNKFLITDAKYFIHRLNFFNTAITSRNSMQYRDTFIVQLQATIPNSNLETITGIGEAAPIVGLSRECPTSNKLKKVERELKLLLELLVELNTSANQLLQQNFIDKLNLRQTPSVAMALEMALLDIVNGGKRTYFKNNFTSGKQCININGLIWMGTNKKMLADGVRLLKQKFSCVKLKIGNNRLGENNLDDEIAIIKKLRKEEPNLHIRLDANGSFSNIADAKLAFQQFTKLGVHSVEQPFSSSFAKLLQNPMNKTASTNWKKTVDLQKFIRQYEATPHNGKASFIKIAFDEELIEIVEAKHKKHFVAELLLNFFRKEVNEIKTKNKKSNSNRPAAYLVLKPTLLGGFAATEEWIKLAHHFKIGWWITSALESNFGLAAISQFTATMLKKYPSSEHLFQGLGTGNLYENNFSSPISLKKDEMWFYAKKFEKSVQKTATSNINTNKNSSESNSSAKNVVEHGDANKRQAKKSSFLFSPSGNFWLQGF